MIGSIRKHSSWLWWIIAALTIGSFVIFMGSGPARNGGGGSSTGNFGTIYGHTITMQEYSRAKTDFYLYYWMQRQQWPDKTSIRPEEMEEGIYFRLLLAQKARQMEIHVSDAAVVGRASEFLRSFGRNGQAVDINKFAEQVLAPEGLGVADLQNFLRSDMTVQQMVQTIGLSGALVTPQEAGQIYDFRNQEVSAQAVFFSASNYLAQVSSTPSAIAQFYTNNMAVYREPDRVQVSYVFFNVTNYLATALAETLKEKTNFTAYVDSVYAQYGQSQFPDAKTPDDAKSQIRNVIIRNRALTDARQVANDFATDVFSKAPATAENLSTAATQKGFAARTSAPFSANFGPEDFNAPAAFTKAAFELSADEPFAGPIPAVDGFYVIALAHQLPSAIPAFDEISARVTQDYQQRAAVAFAQRAGTNLYYNVSVKMAAGDSFAKAAAASGYAPQLLPPFSLSTTELPELGERASLGEIQQAAFTTLPGHVSAFQPTSDGGFVLFVQKMLPVDTIKKSADMPQFLAQIRRARQNEAFNIWLQAEANRELRATPVFKNQAAAAAQSP